MTTVQLNNNGTVTVTMEVAVSVGKVFSMSPSEGYAGIETGKAEVVDIVTNLGKDTEYESDVSAYTDGELSLYEGDELEQRTAELDNTPFIIYMYISGTDRGERYALPADVFAEHSTSQY